MWLKSFCWCQVIELYQLLICCNFWMYHLTRWTMTIPKYTLRLAIGKCWDPSNAGKLLGLWQEYAYSIVNGTGWFLEGHWQSPSYLFWSHICFFFISQDMWVHGLSVKSGILEGNNAGPKGMCTTSIFDVLWSSVQPAQAMLDTVHNKISVFLEVLL